MLNGSKHLFNLSADDLQRLQELRAERPARTIRRPAVSFGSRVADYVAKTVGSWRFIIAQTIVLAIWIALNLTAFLNHWIRIRSFCSISSCHSRRRMLRRSS
jgi:uncharacterized membrane protein